MSEFVAKNTLLGTAAFWAIMDRRRYTNNENTVSSIWSEQPLWSNPK